NMKKFIAILLLIFFAGGMYYFSSQSGEISSNQSNKVVQIIDEIRDKVTLKDQRIISIKEKVFNKLKQYGNKNYVVRKLAHFSIYACIGLSMSYVIYLFSKKIFISSILAFMITSLYAYYDEFRQLSVIGRSGSLKDVLIDSSGAFTGIIVFIILAGGIKSIKSIFKKS
ncbi:MAG: VanZ family protein, partial [Peptostreptococcaceae bacterium]